MAFFVDVHVILDIPSREELGRWLLYCIALVWLTGLSVLTSVALPMLLAAVGVLFVVGKIIWELPLGDGPFGSLIRFACQALIGVAIVLLGVHYGRHRQTVEEWVAVKLAARRAGRLNHAAPLEPNFVGLS